MGDLFEGRVVLGESKFVTLHSLRVLEVDIAHYKHHLNILDQAISDCKQCKDEVNVLEELYAQNCTYNSQYKCVEDCCLVFKLVRIAVVHGLLCNNLYIPKNNI